MQNLYGRPPVSLPAKAVSALTKCIGLGFKRPHIARITYRGHDHNTRQAI